MSPIVYPNTSQVPLWRIPPTRSESPIRAWRCWKLAELTRGRKKPELVLASVGVSCAWEGPVLRAHVKPYDVETWDKSMDSEVWHGGIYALNSAALALETAGMYHANCLGIVDLWGRVVRFERGWRGELCMIKKLFVLNVNGELSNKQIDSLCDRYECDVVRYNVSVQVGYFPADWPEVVITDLEKPV